MSSEPTVEERAIKFLEGLWGARTQYTFDCAVKLVAGALRAASQVAREERDREWSKGHGFPDDEVLVPESAADHIHNCELTAREERDREWLKALNVTYTKEPPQTTEDLESIVGAVSVVAGEAAREEEAQAWRDACHSDAPHVMSDYRHSDVTVAWDKGLLAGCAQAFDEAIELADDHECTTRYDTPCMCDTEIALALRALKAKGRGRERV